MHNFRASIKFILFVSFTILCLLIGGFTYRISVPTHEKLLKFYFNFVLKIFGVKVHEQGFENLPDDSVLYVSNHTSYLDIIVLGSKISARYTPKIEVSKWPIINVLVNLSLPVYIQRDALRSLEQKETIQDIIKSGDSIVLFPEGTTNDGTKVLPFKTSLFSVAEPNLDEETSTRDDDKNICVQPISIVYTKIDGMPADAKNLDKIAWYGDMKFLPHFWNLLGVKGAEVKLIYHQGVKFSDFGCRKELSKHCENVINEGFSS
ncbi:MAG: lysophospholipid acyltransferase family protein [Rickettsiales bacterium]|nr:lysophospholipid acyltransferase family protein [Rickettsiales bacterium]